MPKQEQHTPPKDRSTVQSVMMVIMTTHRRTMEQPYCNLRGCVSRETDVTSWIW